jgi:hypothetical protein
MRGIRAAAALAMATTVVVGAGGAVDAQQPPSFDIDPTSGPVGTTVAYSGEDCPGDRPDMIRVYFSSTSTPGWSGVVDTTTPETDGSFSGSFEVPDSVGFTPQGEPIPTEPGEHKVIVDCSSFAYGDESMVTWFTVTGSGSTSSTTTTTETTPTTASTSPTTAAFTPPPTPPADAEPITTALPSPAPGGSFTLTEGGFEPGEDVVVVLYSAPVVLASTTANGEGVISASLTIPAGTAPGTHTLVLYGESTTKAATITVQAATPAPAGQQPRTLPRTGTQAWMPTALVAAALFLLSGAHLVGRSRRATR